MTMNVFGNDVMEDSLALADVGGSGRSGISPSSSERARSSSEANYYDGGSRKPAGRKKLSRRASYSASTVLSQYGDETAYLESSRSSHDIADRQRLM